MNIHALERYVGDEAIRHGWTFDRPASESGKHVLVVGAVRPAYRLHIICGDWDIR